MGDERGTLTKRVTSSQGQKQYLLDIPFKIILSVHLKPMGHVGLLSSPGHQKWLIGDFGLQERKEILPCMKQSYPCQ